MQPDDPGQYFEQAVRLRLRLLGRMAGGRAFGRRRRGSASATEMVAWVLNGRVSELDMPRDASLALRLEVLVFVAEHLGFDDMLGTVAAPIAAADQVLAWLTAPRIGPVPRHYYVTAVPADQVDQAGRPCLAPVSRFTRVANPPAAEIFVGTPEDAL